MAADGYLNFDTKINTKGFNKGLGDIGSSIGSLKSMLKSLAVTAAAAFSVRAIVRFGKQAVEIASDMQEVQNVVDTAFGEMSYKMEDFANKSIKQFGISRLAAKQTGSTYMAMARGMGIASDAASDMAVNLTGLSADMASFYNVEQNVASTALKSIFTGETETLKQFGIVMTDANLQAFALSQGINKSTSAMTQAEKVQLRYNYVMQQTVLAQGDFAKTSGGWANQTRILSEQWKEFSSVIGGAIMNVALPVIRGLNNALSELISYANSAYNALAEFFGWEQQVSSNAAGITNDISASVDEQNALTDAVNETAKAQENALAGFDKINKLSDGSSENKSAVQVSSSSPAAVTMPVTVTTDADTKPAESKITESLNRIKAALSDAFYPLKSAWNDYGAPFVTSFKTGLSGLAGLASSIGGSIAEVWTNGTGYETSALVLQIWTDINNCIGNAADSIKRAWDENNTGTSIIQGIANILNVILGHIHNINSATAEWWKTVDFSPLFISIKGLLDEIEPFVDNVGSAFEWLYNEVLHPLSSWVIEDALPASIDLVSGAIDVLNSVIDAFEPFGEWLWDKFLEPIAKWTGGVIVDVIEDIAGALKKVSDWISKHKTAVQDLAIVVGSLGAAFKIAGIITAATAALSAAGGIMGILSGITAALTGITTALAGAFTFLTSPITLVCLAIGAIIAIGVLLVKHWDEVKEFAAEMWESIRETIQSFFDRVKVIFNALVTFFKGIWNNICSVFSDVGNWFKDKFTEAWNGIKFAFSAVKTWFQNRLDDIKGVFSGIGDWFGEKFTDAWDGIKSAFSSVGSFFREVWTKIKSPFNKMAEWFSNTFTGAKDMIVSAFETLSDALKTPLNWVIDLVNDVIGKLNNFSIDLPDWAVEIVGVDHIGFNLPEIPHLAQGTVVPANYGEFLAVLGDNKRETEVVSPISTIEKAVENVLGRQQGSDTNLNVYLDGKLIYKTVIKKNNESIRMTGKNPLVPA